MKKLLSVLAKAIVFFVGWLLLASRIPIPATDNDAVWRLYAELIPCITILIFTAIFLKIDRCQVRIPIAGNPIRSSIIGFVTGALWIAVSVIILMVVGAIDFSKSAPIPMLWLWLLSALLNTIMQELLVRGYLYQLIKANYGIAPAVICMTLLFTLLHGGALEAGLLPVLNVLTASLLMTAVLEYTGSLLAPILTHFVWNGVGGILLGGVSLADDYPSLLHMTTHGSALLSGGDCKIEGSIVVLLTNLVLTAGILWRRRGRRKCLHR